MRWKVILVLLGIVGLYLLVGAAAFWALEYEEFVPTDITTLPVYTDFLAQNPTVSAADLAAFTNSVVSASSNGGVVGNATSQDNGWTYENSLYFCVTIVSTIGYGHITPTTVGGKVFCIFYALLGIPLAAALLAGIGSKMSTGFKRLHKAKPWYRGNSDRDRWIKISFTPSPGESGVMSLSGLALMLLVPAAVFTKTEGWDYVSSVYYATISLTTVGFGDYVAGGKTWSTALHKTLMCLWLLLGLAFLAMIVSEASEIYVRFSSKRVDNGSHNENEAKDADEETPKEKDKRKKKEKVELNEVDIKSVASAEAP